MAHSHLSIPFGKETLDSQLRMTGVFAGDLVEAHLAVFEAMRAFVEVPIQEPFDIALTHGGYVGRNHYQCAKAAVGAKAAEVLRTLGGGIDDYFGVGVPVKRQ